MGLIDILKLGPPSQGWRIEKAVLGDNIPTWVLGSGTADNTTFLRGDLTWAPFPILPGFITGVSNTLTINLSVLAGILSADFASTNISQFINNTGYITGPQVPAFETDPVFGAWLAGPPNVSLFTNDVPYLITVSVDGVTITGDGTLGNPLIAVAAGGGETLAQTLVLGNITGGTNITITDGDFIEGSAGQVQIDFGSDAYLYLNLDAGAGLLPYIDLEPTYVSVVGVNGSGGQFYTDVLSSTVNHNILVQLVSASTQVTSLTGVGTRMVTADATGILSTTVIPSGTVTSVAVSGLNGIGIAGSPITTSGTITLSLGAITPTSVNGITLSGSGSIANTGVSSLTTFVGSGTSSGTNTGDQTIAGLSPLTTKGDIFTYSTVNTRLAVGATDGQILGVSAAAATGQVWSTPSYPMATGTARTIIVSNGTNNVYSTETYATPGASGNILTSDGTNWTSAAPATSGTVTSVSGTVNRITSTGGATPVIDISATYDALWQPVDGDLTAIAALGFASTSFLKKTAANTWMLDTNTYLSNTPAALSRVDDTNVTLTLGGTPLTSLLQSVSLTLGWTGTLADGRIASSTDWNTAYTNRITSLTVTGNSGASTLIANTLNVPTYTLSGLGGTTLAAVNAQNLSVFAATTSAQLAGVISNETGSGLLVFDTAPTLTKPIIAAGAAAVGSAPITFTPSGAVLLTAAVAGAMEVDASGYPYYTYATSERGVISAVQHITLTSNYTTGGGTTAAQALFNSPANGRVTVAGSTTYYFECAFSLSSMSASSGNFSFGIGGTATFTRVKWFSNGIKASAATPVAPTTRYNNVSGLASISANNINTIGWAVITGKLVVAAGGTIIPQFATSVAAATVVEADSFFKIWAAGSNTVQSVGNWD